MERRIALVVDRDAGRRDRICAALEGRGATVHAVATLSDPRPPKMDVLVVAPGQTDQELGAFVRRSRRRNPGLVIGARLVALDAAAAAYDAAIDSDEQGAIDWMCVRLLRAASDEARAVARDAFESPASRSLEQRIAGLAQSDAPLFLCGPSGCGKETAARRIHRRSRRAPLPFYVVDARVRPDEALGRELFGDGNGPGAAFADSQGGSLLVRHIPALPQAIQKRLAQIVEAGPGDVRVMATAAEDPGWLARRGRLVAELRRCFETVLNVPSLRDRCDDIPLLVRRQLSEVERLNDLPSLRIDADALDRLQAYEWPGNLRELRNVIERAVVLSPDGMVRRRDLPEPIRSTSPEDGATVPIPTRITAARPFKESKREVVDAFEQAYLNDLLTRHGGNVTAAAQHAGMLRSALQRLLRKHGLRSADYRQSQLEPPARP